MIGGFVHTGQNNQRRAIPSSPFADLQQANVELYNFGILHGGNLAEFSHVDRQLWVHFGRWERRLHSYKAVAQAGGLPCDAGYS
jgi:hypothetical protein